MFIRMILDGIAALTFLAQGKPKALVSVWKAHIDFYKSLRTLRVKRKAVERSFPANPGKFILNKSVVFEFYIKGIKTFDRLKTNF
jgi:hypothetical protein